MAIKNAEKGKHATSNSNINVNAASLGRLLNHEHHGHRNNC